MPEKVQEGNAELAMMDFGSDLYEMNELVNAKAHRGSNLSAMDTATIRAIRQNPKIKVVMTDKNL